MKVNGYKAFNPGFVCHGKQYAENTTFEEPEAKLCKKGMHFCKDPIDVLNYYPLVNGKGEFSEFAAVVADGDIKTHGNKSCTTKLHIGAKLSFGGFIDACVDFLIEKTKNKHGSSGDSAKIGSSGDSAKIGSSGDYAQIGSSGNYAQIGSSGDYAQIGSSGNYAQIGSSGENCVICCSGGGSSAKAKIGSWITLSEWKIIDGKLTPICVKTEQVDGTRIKEDTIYLLKNGEFVEVS